nr:hypothetical protein [uncultured Leptotrichia sp.]
MKEILKNFIKVTSPFIFGFFITGISLSILLPYVASRHEVYKDIILETVALEGSNKSGEMFAIWISLLIGGISIFIFKYIEDKKNISILKENIKLDFVGIGIIIIPSIFILFFKQEINFYLVFIGIIYYVTYFLTDKNILLSKQILIFFISIYIFSMSLKVVLDKIIKNLELIKIDMVFPVSIILFIVLLIKLKKENFFNIEKKILFFQIPGPLILLSFLTNKYLLNGEIYKINKLTNYKVTIVILIVTLLFINIVQYKRKKNNKLILFSSTIIIFILHYYSFPMSIHNGDFWHIGEITVPWQQIVIKKMELFKEYNGTSGLYGLILGFFQNVVLDGTALSFYSALSLTHIFWAVIIGSVCYFLVGDFSLILAFFINIPEYDRPVLLLVTLLILMFPKLIKKRIIWLQIYILFSIIGFFYYPLNGVAFAIGLFPFFIVQLYCSIKEKMWRKEMSSVFFWILNVILIISFINLYKLVIGMLKNIILLSSQTKLADGIAIYNYSVPSYWFLKFIKSDILKKHVWYIFICSIIVSAVLIFWYLIYYYFQKYRNKKLILKLDSPIFLILSSASIILPVNYTYTLVRMDHESEYARTSYTMIVFVGFVLSILLYKYGKRLFSGNLKIIFIGLALGFTYLVNGNVIGSEVEKLSRVYIVPDEFTYIEGQKIGIPKLGKGFLKKDTLNSIEIIKYNIEKLAIKKDTFWPNLRRELFYIFDSKVPVKIDSMKLTKSLKSSKENIKMLEKDPPALITDMMNYESYYTYRWLLNHGYIMYVDRGETFWVRPDIYEKKIGKLSEGRKNMFDIFPSQEIKKIPYSLGNSIKTLLPIFSEKKEINTENLNLRYNQLEKIGKNKFKIVDKTDPFFVIDLPKTVTGGEFDFILMDLNSNYPLKKLENLKIQLFWGSKELPLNENRTLRFDYGNGKLLIPVGIHPAWLSSNITKLRIDFDNADPGMEFKIKKLEFLRLNLNRKN